MHTIFHHVLAIVADGIVWESLKAIWNFWLGIDAVSRLRLWWKRNRY